MDFMTSEALTELWEAEQRARRHENEFWRLADELLEVGLIRVEDVAAIWGCHESTARNRLRAWRDRVPARAASQYVYPSNGGRAHPSKDMQP